MTASRTTPTLCVLVMRMGAPSAPDSSSHVVPVISPLPFSVCHAPKTRPRKVFPCGRIAVTPVRTGPRPATSLPSPETSVVCPTSTPFTSVIAFERAGRPLERHAEVARPRLRLRARGVSDEEDAQHDAHLGDEPRRAARQDGRPDERLVERLDG